MSVTINLSSEDVAKIKRSTQLDSESEAVAKAAREFLRVIQLRELKAATGNQDYQGVGEDMEALELRERHPQASVFSSDPHFDLIPGLKRYP